MHRSATCEVFNARDLKDQKPVVLSHISAAIQFLSHPCLQVLKFMKGRDQFEQEIKFRHNLVGCSDEVVINVLGFHLPSGDEEMDGEMKEWVQELQREPHSPTREPHLPSGLDDFPYVLVLDKGDMSAHQYTSSQRVAGFDAKKVIHLYCKPLYYG